MRCAILTCSSLRVAYRFCSPPEMEGSPQRLAFLALEKVNRTPQQLFIRALMMSLLCRQLSPPHSQHALSTFNSIFITASAYSNYSFAQCDVGWRDTERSRERRESISGRVLQLFRPGFMAYVLSSLYSPSNYCLIMRTNDPHSVSQRPPL